MQLLTLLSTGKYDIGQTSEVQISVVKLRDGTPFNLSAYLVETRLYISGSAVSNSIPWMVNYPAAASVQSGCEIPQFPPLITVGHRV